MIREGIQGWYVISIIHEIAKKSCIQHNPATIVNSYLIRCFEEDLHEIGFPGNYQA